METMKSYTIVDIMSIWDVARIKFTCTCNTVNVRILLQLFRYFAENTENTE